MGRTKNPPKRKLDLVSAEPPGVEPAPDVGVAEPAAQSSDPPPPQFVNVAIGPNRTISIQVKARTKPKAKRKKLVVDAVEEQVAAYPPQPLEVGEIIIQDNISEIHLCPRVAPNPPDRWRLLQRVHLEQSQLMVPEELPVDDTYFIQSAEGASALLGLLNLGNMDALGHAIEDGTVQLECQNVQSKITVSIYLTRKSLLVCSSETLAFGSLGKKNVPKKWMSAMHLYQALAAIFPDSVLVDVVQRTTGPPITAKMVYAKVDNVQLSNYEQQDRKPMADIPGLVPTLRLYQQASVSWMLKRERGETLGGEWELAWVVLVGTRLLPLHQLKERDQAMLFISPFAGWIKESYDEARIATLGHDLMPVNGGILANSMGTGKTVEVIACILANPYLGRVEGKQTVAAAQVAAMKDEHQINDALSKVEPGEEEGDQDEGPTICTPVKQRPPKTMSDFDNDVSDDDEKEAEANNSLMHVEHLGVCMCGQAKLFNNGLSLVLCGSCDEPMHGVCAGFTSIEELLNETRAEWRSDSVCDKYTARICMENRCPSCVFSNREKRLINSRATLIVTPPSILHQWEREIRRHTAIYPDIPQSMSPIVSPHKPNKRPLKVLVYPGIRELYRKKPGTLDESSGQLICHLMHPDKLADADVVLMTFESLMGDLGHTDENPFTDNCNHQGLRTRKRYRVNPSPLTSIKWWRICLDEAQRVEVPTATSARMALKLEAHFRWCVSGTPIGRGKLDDLYGLVLFLRLYPFAGKQWFDQCLHSGHAGVMERVRFVLQDVMWRSTKASPSVRIQMGVPEQIEKKVLLKFSSIEKHFYERQLERTMVAASDVVGKSGEAAQLKGKTDLLAVQLHRLRAACCHPQVGSSGIAKVGKKRKVKAGDTSGVSIGTAVLTMDQILDRLIDDAKIQCEESQRIAVLHTNAMASLSRLKVEAKSRGDVSFSDSDESLLAQSCRSYMESLEIAEANSKPTPLVGEAVVTGCRGFLSQRKLVRDGKAIIMWKIKAQGVELTNMRKLWARFDFEGPSKKITDARVKMLATVPIEFQDELGPNDVLLKPKTAAFQVAHSSLGGEFVDVVDFDFNADAIDDNGWLSKGGFRTNKSKGWRLLLNDYGFDGDYSSHVTCDDMHTFFVAVEIQMLEADVASDSLQRLHALHNLSLSMSALSQLGGEHSSSQLSITEMKKKMDIMHAESRRIESLYMDAAKAPHMEILRDLRHYSNERSKIEEEFLAISNCTKKKKDKIGDLWQDLWWDDLLAICFVHGGHYDRERLCDMMHVALDEFVTDTVEGQKFRSRPIDQKRYKGFPNFQDVDGLRTGLGFRLAEYLSTLKGKTHTKTIDEVLVLSAQPSEMEIYENSRCGKCREDWNQTGPTCRHCHLEKRLKKILPDHFILCVLKTLWKWLKDTRNLGNVSAALEEAKVFDRASLFFDLVKANETELQKARKAWSTHFDLLSDIDELNQCKRSMRLAQEGEDLTKLTDDELNAIVAPWDIASRHLDHCTKQAMALANLRRNTHTLRYLRNQSLERQAEEERKKSGTFREEDENTCLVCLSTFCGERAVLACGHSFHHSPCMERLVERTPGNSVITCPLRCTKTTKRDEVMIATDRRKDDGSKGTRTIEGSFGTKVTRLLGDLMDVAELGDKSIVFSQWEDMLDVVEHALVANGVSYARVKTMARLGDTIKHFRSHECFVLLLNVKNGAEGITLVEATHVFMIEPLLNCGLDSQAIARVNRIGQTSKTYVHRYLVEGTIEVKIDNIRVEREEDQLEDSISEAKKKHDVSAGGIDGGFTEAELQDILK